MGPGEAKDRQADGQFLKVDKETQSSLTGPMCEKFVFVGRGEIKRERRRSMKTARPFETGAMLRKTRRRRELTWVLKRETSSGDTRSTWTGRKNEKNKSPVSWKDSSRGKSLK